MVGRLNRRTIFDPRFTSGFGVVPNAAMTSRVIVRRYLGNDDGNYNFDDGARPSDGFLQLVTSLARVQPNADWRARQYTFGEETTVFQACRFQLPATGDNIVWNVDIPDDERFFKDEDQVVITDNFFPNLDQLKQFVFLVRNPIGSGYASTRDLLCDVDIKGGLSIGNTQ